MKLLYITNARIPSRRAHSVQIMKMCEAFSRASLPQGKKVEVELVVAKRREAIAEDPFDYYGVTHSFTIKKLPCIDLALGKFGHVLQLASFAIVGLVYTMTHKADLIYTRDEIFAPLIALTPWRKKTVYEVHTRRDFFFTRIALQHIPRLVMISGGLKTYYTQTYHIDPDKILVAHDGATLESFAFMESKNELRTRLGLPTDRFIVGHIGKATTLGKPKGVEEVVQAAAQARATQPEVFLLLAGLEAGEFPIMQALLKEANMPEDSYALVGHIPQKDFPIYFVTCDALIMNYPDTEHYRLFMSPIKMFEYMASKAAIITTDLPVVREVLSDDEAWFVKAGDTDGLAKRIGEVVEHKQEAAAKSRHAFEKVKEYSWQKRANAILEATH